MKHNYSMLDIEAFVAVGSHLNYRSAAKALNISPSTLSRRVKKLESAANTQLLIRTTRDVKLTLAGREFYSQAQMILAEVGALLNIGQGHGQHGSPITIACTNLYTQMFMPEAVKRFAKLFPHVPVKVIAPGATEVANSVRNGTADFGLGDMSLQEPTLEFVPTFSDRVVLAVPFGHDFVGRRQMEWDEISDENFISVSRGLPIRALLDFELAKEGRNVSTFYEVSNSFTALSFVASGLGVTAVTELAARSFLRSIVTIPLCNPEIYSTQSLIRARDRFMKPSVEAMWELLSAEWDQIAASLDGENS